MPSRSKMLVSSSLAKWGQKGVIFIVRALQEEKEWIINISSQLLRISQVIRPARMFYDLELSTFYKRTK